MEIVQSWKQNFKAHKIRNNKYNTIFPTDFNVFLLNFVLFTQQYGLTLRKLRTALFFLCTISNVHMEPKM
jgi:hypothetical protein